MAAIDSEETQEIDAEAELAQSSAVWGRAGRAPGARIARSAFAARPTEGPRAGRFARRHGVDISHGHYRGAIRTRGGTGLREPVRAHRPRAGAGATRGRAAGAARAPGGARDRGLRRLRQRPHAARRALQQRGAGRDDQRHAPALPARRAPPPAAERRGGGRARQAHRARRPSGQGAHGQLEPAPRRLAGEEVPGPRARAARPDPGGHPRPDPRRREVRLAQGLQVLDLRDLLDPPGDPARPRQPGPHDPDPGSHRPARAQDRAGGARAGGQARPAADRRGGRSRRPISRSRS